jgi:hypothetical protein
MKIHADYHRELNHNYLLLDRQCSQDKDEYQNRMLVSHKWMHFISCSERNINGRYIIYYEINSKTSLSNYYAGVKMRFSDMTGLLSQIEAACAELADYMMDEDGIVLDPEYIFYDMDRKSYCFIYYPGEDQGNDEEKDRNKLSELLDFMLGAADENDAETTDFIYKLYESAEQENFSLAEAMEKYRDHGTGHENVQYTAEVSTGPEETAEVDRSRQYISTDEDDTGKSHLPFLIISGVMAAGLCGAAVIYRAFTMDDREKLIFFAACAVMLFAGSASGVICLLRKKNENAAGKEERLRKFPDTAESAATAGDIWDAEKHITADIKPGDECTDGKTVFFTKETDPSKYKLYATDRKNGQHISLEKIPCVVGKLAGNVDICVKNQSISRIHARIDYNGACYTVTDLNSTNGTYVNGMQLDPNETVELTEGDEVRFGELNYCLR